MSQFPLIRQNRRYPRQLRDFNVQPLYPPPLLGLPGHPHLRVKDFTLQTPTARTDNATRAGVLEGMIDLVGGTRPRHMDKFCLLGMRLLLGVSARTPETVAIFPQVIDLLLDGSLRALEVAGRS